MNTEAWYILPINPDPWAIGPLGVGKRNGKYFPYVGRNNQLYSYQQAIKEELVSQNARLLPEGKYELEFFFWRRLDSHASGKKHYADVTNLQKATEDALQGVLFDNDRDVVNVNSWIMHQDTDTNYCVVIHARTFDNEYPTLPEVVMAIQANLTIETQLSDNIWRGPY
jgi:hypothetical protein